MSNLIDIQGQIEKLQKQASDIRSREFDKTVQEILLTMRAFGIGIKDLQSAASKAGKARAAQVVKRGRAKTAKTSAGSTVAAKFRGPGGETWSGRGLMPRWMAALVAQGRQKEDFAIKS